MNSGDSNSKRQRVLPQQEALFHRILRRVDEIADAIQATRNPDYPAGYLQPGETVENERYHERKQFLEELELYERAEGYEKEHTLETIRGLVRDGGLARLVDTWANTDNEETMRDVVIIIGGLFNIFINNG